MAMQPVAPSESLRAGRPGRDTSIVVVREWLTLSGFIPEWEELAAAAIEPNVFYEHWMLLPALQAAGSDRDICFALVLMRDPGNRLAPPKLGGLFPLEFVQSVDRLHEPALRVWQPLACPMGTPLIRADAVRECLVELVLWLRSGEAGAPQIELKWPSGDSRFQRAMKNLLPDRGLVHWTKDTSTRSLLRRKGGAAAGLWPAVPDALRRQLERKAKRLSERGCLEHVALKPGGDVQAWVDDYLRIDASSWKRRYGKAAVWDSQYFHDVAGGAFERGRLLMLGINLDGAPIARSCTLIADGGSFALGTTFDERFARFSPGVLLELDNVRHLDALPGVDWIDPCPGRQSVLINRLSNEHRTIQGLTIGGSTSESPPARG
jgi:hypothetical protein